MNARNENIQELIEGGISFDDALQLQKIARTLHALDEHSCNGYRSERAEKSADTREENLVKKANEIAEKYSRVAYHQSDPRGWSLYICQPSERLSSVYNRGLGVFPR